MNRHLFAVPYLLCHDYDVKQASWRFELPAFGMFIKPFSLGIIRKKKKNINGPYQWPLIRGIYFDLLVPSLRAINAIMGSLFWHH